MIRICWWGKASRLHGIDKIIGSVKKLHHNYPEIKLSIFEDDAKRAEYLKQSYMGLEPDIGDFLDVRSDMTFSTGLGEYLSDEADIVLGVFGGTELGMTVVPNKVVEAMALGAPVVTQAATALNEFNLIGDGLKVVDPDNTFENEIEDIIVRCRENSKYIEDLQCGLVQKYNENFNVKLYRSRMLRVLWGNEAFTASMHREAFDEQVR